jgi:hypothetical protein
MKRIYEFACVCGQRTEALTAYETVTVQCGCGGTASRVISAPNSTWKAGLVRFPLPTGGLNTDTLRS